MDLACENFMATRSAEEQAVSFGVWSGSFSVVIDEIEQVPIATNLYRKFLIYWEENQGNYKELSEYKLVAYSYGKIYLGDPYQNKTFTGFEYDTTDEEIADALIEKEFKSARTK